MKQSNRLHLRPSHLVSHAGESFLITDLRGFMSGGIEGFYYRQTRFHSRLLCTIDGKTPTPFSAVLVDSHSSTA